MGFLKNQFSSVIEWNENGSGVLFYKFQNQEIKKGSRLIIRPGQDAIFLYNGRVEGVFVEDGDYDIESDIIPFLTTLKSFKFGFSTPLRAEVLFINTKELMVKWGTKNAINLPAPGLPGGMKERIIASLDQLLMSWISKEGRDMFNLQADARNIAKGIESELDADMRTLGIAISGFTIESFSYPEEIRKMQEKAAAQSMVGDMNKYTQMAAADSIGKGGSGAGMAADMVGLQMGMAIGQQMVNQMNMGGANAAGQGQQMGQPAAQGGQGPKFCPNCGTPTTGFKFCGNCGNQLL